MEVVASLSQGRTAAAQCGLFTHKSVPVISEPPCNKYSARYHKCTYVSCKVPVILVSFQSELIFSIGFQKILGYQISQKFVQWETSSSMQTNRWMDKLKWQSY